MNGQEIGTPLAIFHAFLTQLANRRVFQMLPLILYDAAGLPMDGNVFDGKCTIAFQDGRT